MILSCIALQLAARLAAPLRLFDIISGGGSQPASSVMMSQVSFVDNKLAENKKDKDTETV